MSEVKRSELDTVRNQRDDLLKMLEWCVWHSDWRLIDHPERLKYAAELVARVTKEAQ